jgi:hypothetical protein
MSEKRYVVPEGGVEAFWAEFSGGLRGPESDRRTRDGLAAFARWLSENPIVPTHEQRIELTDKFYNLDVPATERFQALFAEWQRRMFLAPGPEVPEEIKDLLLQEDVKNAFFRPDIVNERVLEAYRRGQKAGIGKATAKHKDAIDAAFQSGRNQGKPWGGMW